MRILAGLVLACLCLSAGSLPVRAGDPIINFRTGDPEMNAAITEARSTLDGFLSGIADGSIPAADASLKVAVPSSQGAEHIWMGAFQRLADGSFQATVGNEPNFVPDLKLGDRYVFEAGQISDWMYFANDQLHGAYTLRVMLPRMPAHQAAQFLAILAPLP